MADDVGETVEHKPIGYDDDGRPFDCAVDGEPWPCSRATLLRAADFEEPLGDSTIRIFEGHPCYCPITTRHDPHDYRYRYLRADGEPWKGSYYCDGDPAEFAPRPTARMGRI